jgi:L-2-hydroxyglutarate oxidase LhgO
VIKLKNLILKAEQNGVNGLTLLTKSDVSKLEPKVECVAAVFSPETGIFDSHEFMKNLENDAMNYGCSFVFNCQVSSIRWMPDTAVTNHPPFLVNTNQGDIKGHIIINASGLSSIHLAHKVDLPDLMKPHYIINLPQKSYYAKGNYFKLNDSSFKPFNHLVYPVPAGETGLGIHATIDLNRYVRFGPDVEWIEDDTLQDAYDPYGFPPDTAFIPDYIVNENRKELFKSSISTYWPDVMNHDLIPDYAGIRPKLIGPRHDRNNHISNKNNRDLHDFWFSDSAQHGVKGLIHLFGIESPGLTSSLTIAEYITNIAIKEI